MRQAGAKILGKDVAHDFSLLIAPGLSMHMGVWKGVRELNSP